MSRVVKEIDRNLEVMESAARDPEGISPGRPDLVEGKDAPIADSRKLELEPSRDLNEEIQAKPETDVKDCVRDLDQVGKEELVVESQLEMLPEVAPAAAAEIIKMMDSPRDLASLLEASPSFRSKVYRLSKHPDNWLWKQVFTSQDFLDHFNGTDEAIRGFLAEFPRYKFVVDTFFGLVYRLQPDYKSCKFLQPKSQAPYFVQGKENGQNWLWVDVLRERTRSNRSNQFASASVTSSPFTKGCLLYNNTGNRNFQRCPGYTEKVVNVLERFGNEVHLAIIESPTSTINSALKSLLPQTPNLVALEVSLCDEEEHGVSDVSSTQELPKLPNLVSLIIFNTHQVPSIILSPLSIYFEQITVLDVSDDWVSFLDIYDPSIHPRFINLQSLSVCILKKEQPSKFLAAFGGPEAIRLKRIKLDARAVIPRFHIYLRLMEPFRSTLQLAEIVHGYGYDDYFGDEFDEGPFMEQRAGTGPSPPFSFPVLRVLSIYMEMDYMSLSRLRDLQSLGYLSLNASAFYGKPYWRKTMELEEDLPEIPSIYDHYEDLNRSDIWKIIPSLNQIKQHDGADEPGEASELEDERVYNRERF